MAESASSRNSSIYPKSERFFWELERRATDLCKKHPDAAQEIEDLKNFVIEEHKDAIVETLESVRGMMRVEH